MKTHYLVPGMSNSTSQDVLEERGGQAGSLLFNFNVYQNSLLRRTTEFLPHALKIVP